MKKNLLLMFLILVLIFTAGCSKKGGGDNQTPEYINPKVSNYILTNPKGVVALFDLQGDLIERLDIGSTNSDFIYTLDSGNVYAESLNKAKYINNILYA